MKHKNLSRRKFISQSGAILSGATAAMLVPNSLLASPNIFSFLKKEKSEIKFSMYLYTLMNAPTKMENLNIAEICRRTREMGIEGLDFIGSGYNKSWKEIKKIADDNGVKIICYTKGVNEFESPNGVDRKEGLENFRKNLEIAHTLGSSRIMMNQGGKKYGNDSDTNRKWMIETLKEALPIATAEGIEVTVETHNSEFAPFRTSAHFSEAIAVVPDLKVCFDSGNDFGNGEDPLQGYLNNKEHITHVHFKDLNADSTIGNPRGLAIPGTGVVDFPSIISAMKENGYNGYINLEKGGPDGFEVYKKAMGILGPLIA